MKFFIILAAILSVLTIFSVGYFQKRKNKMKKLKEIISNADKYDLIISRTRQERSKDSNGTEIVIKIKDNTLYYTERNWGFKARTGVIEKEIILDIADIKYIHDFIKENKLNKNYKKEIKIKKKHSFMTYTYDVTLKFDDEYYKIYIVSNTENMKSSFMPEGHKNKFFGKIQELYSFLKSKK